MLKRTGRLVDKVFNYSIPMLKDVIIFKQSKVTFWSFTEKGSVTTICFRRKYIQAVFQKILCLFQRSLIAGRYLSLGSIFFWKNKFFLHWYQITSKQFNTRIKTHVKKHVLSVSVNTMTNLKLSIKHVFSLWTGQWRIKILIFFYIL